jgi:hypothetical protein
MSSAKSNPQAGFPGKPEADAFLPVNGKTPSPLMGIGVSQESLVGTMTGVMLRRPAPTGVPPSLPT